MTGEEAIREYGPMARRISHEYFLPGGDREDVEQEAYIGILRALDSYRPEVGVPLRQFVAICVRRKLIERVTMANAAKHGPLNDSLRHAPETDGLTPLNYVESLPDDRFDRLVEARAELAEILDRLPDLSPIERVSLLAVAAGWSYDEIEEAVGLRFKAVDNAVQRARRKLRAA